jgi:hydroxypyruvate isomerase
MKTKITRRNALKSLGCAVTTFGILTPLVKKVDAAEVVGKAKLKGNIRHSVSRWCYGKLSLDELCKACVEIGIESVELLGPSDWPTVKKYGLTCAMCNGPDRIDYGFNRVEHHDDLIAKFEKAIPQVAEAGFPNIICFSGNRRGMSDEEGLENCVKGLKRLMPIAEKYKVNVVLELLNSKVNHKDYMADHTAWGVELCKRVGSERLKLLYDIYHMQIMEGDLIRTIKENYQYIGHYHTGGNPGRNEIDETQEIYYPAVMRAIVSTGYKGFVGQEFVPKRDPLTSLRQAIMICDV